jgi:membrane-bound lytic murein transglycosylase F
LALVWQSSQAQFPDQYDQWFRETAIRYLYTYLPDDDWRWWKAQCYQESRLKPDAVSPAGAVGLCQLISGAARDAGLDPLLRTDERRNVKAGAWILRRNLRVWWRRDDRLEHLKLGWASYNAGAGRIIKAQALCDDAPLWDGISQCLQCVTGPKNSAETIGYVRLIPHWYAALAE